MPKNKKPVWQELGLKPVYSPSGSRKGFEDASGNYIPERQFRKMVGTPMKGSKGHKERQEAKKEGKKFRPWTEDKIYKEMKEAAKTPGMTLEQFMTGKAHEIAYSNRRTQETHNRYIDQQRREAINFKVMAGAMTKKEATQARRELTKHINLRNKIIDIRDKIQTGDISREERAALWTQFRKEINKLGKSQKKIEDLGLVIMDDLPSEESLRYGYYH